MIGASRKILDSLLMNHKGPLTHEVLTTFLMEVSAILNARPLVAISTDPDAPQVLSPDMCIHQKTAHTLQLDIPEFGTKDAGNTFSNWRISSGKDGKWSTCTPYRLVRNG